jgi:hypothetical protein
MYIEMANKFIKKSVGYFFVGGLLCIFFMLILSSFKLIPSYWRIPYTNIGLSYTGFFLPLVISISLIWYFNEEIHLPKSYVIITVIILILIGIISYFIPQMQYQGTRGVHANIYEFFAVWSLIFLLVKKGYSKEACILSFPLVFLTGVITDIDSITILKGFIIFGGDGILDGDILYPTIS